MIDNREIIAPSDFPYTTATAIDVLPRDRNNVIIRGIVGTGSGITIAPEHVLTAGHVAFFEPRNKPLFRATVSAEQNDYNRSRRS